MEAEKSLTWVCDQLKASNWSAENRKKVNDLACENIRFSSLFAAGDVSRGGTSATQQQKFHTDDHQHDGISMFSQAINDFKKLLDLLFAASNLIFDLGLNV